MAKSPVFTAVSPASMDALYRELVAFFRLLADAFKRLTFEDNFDQRTVEVDFVGTAEVKIANPFRNGVVPTKWIVVDVLNSSSTFTPQRGATPWSTDFFYLRNSSGGNLTAKIMFLR